MRSFNKKFFAFLFATLANASTYSYNIKNVLEIDGGQLSLKVHTECKWSKLSRAELAKYLMQYDPREEPRSDIGDERPWAKLEVKELQKDLVESGFHYPNGSESVITWIDFDGDGICDFTASAGIGGAKSIDRMFLFHGLSNKKFQLIDSNYSYMDTSILIVPYIPIEISGESLPVIINPSAPKMMQWDHERNEFMTCEMLKGQENQLGYISGKNIASGTLLAKLCRHSRKIADWANAHLPRRNEEFNWRMPEKP